VQPESLLEQAQMRWAFWVRVCRESTLECITMLVEVWDRSIRVLTALFKTSDKEGVLSNPDYGDL
jgi:hypothetical protein